VKIGYSLINARSESVAEKPAFRDAFKSRRCLTPADGFYKGKKLDAKTKQPYAIVMKPIFGPAPSSAQRVMRLELRHIEKQDFGIEQHIGKEIVRQRND
jgi:hypothetical protein